MAQAVILCFCCNS